MDSQSQSPALAAAEALRRAHSLLFRRDRRRFSDLGLTGAQVRTLRVIQGLQSRGELPRMSDVAEHLHLSPRTVTDLADGLEEAGCARREPDPSNRRVVRLRLTDHGANHLATARERMLADAAQGLCNLTSEDLAELTRILGKVEGAQPE